MNLEAANSLASVVAYALSVLALWLYVLWTSRDSKTNLVVTSGFFVANVVAVAFSLRYAQTLPLDEAHMTYRWTAMGSACLGIFCLTSGRAAGAVSMFVTLTSFAFTGFMAMQSMALPSGKAPTESLLAEVFRCAPDKGTPHCVVPGYQLGNPGSGRAPLTAEQSATLKNWASVLQGVLREKGFSPQKCFSSASDLRRPVLCTKGDEVYAVGLLPELLGLMTPRSMTAKECLRKSRGPGDRTHALTEAGQVVYLQTPKYAPRGAADCEPLEESWRLAYRTSEGPWELLAMRFHETPASSSESVVSP